MTAASLPPQHVAQRVTDDLLAQLDGAHAVVVATVDGFALAHARRREVDVERLAAIVSSLGALGAAASVETRIGDLRVLVVESATGRLVTRYVEVPGVPPVVVAVLTDGTVPLGLVWTHLRQVNALGGVTA